MSDRPGENAAQRDQRTRQMEHLVLGMQPRDGLEYMLAILTVGHFNLILESMRDIFQGPRDAAQARAKSTVVGLDRQLLGFVRELRLSRKRPAANPPVEARAETPSTTAPTPSHRRIIDKPLPIPMTSQTGKVFSTSPAARPMPLPPAAPAQPPKNIPRHPQPGPADQYLAEFEDVMAAISGKLQVSNALEKQKAAAGT